jgi:hypothetical protein
VSSASFFEFLEQSLAVMRQEMPPAYEAFVGVLEGRRLAIEADGERRVVSFDASGLASHGEHEHVELGVAFDRGTVLDLVDGRVSLPEAVLTDRIALRGAPAAVDRFDRALRSYVQGLVRCPSMPSLLIHFRGESGRG